MSRMTKTVPNILFLSRFDCFGGNPSPFRVGPLAAGDIPIAKDVPSAPRMAMAANSTRTGRPQPTRNRLACNKEASGIASHGLGEDQPGEFHAAGAFLLSAVQNARCGGIGRARCTASTLCSPRSKSDLKLFKQP